MTAWMQALLASRVRATSPRLIARYALAFAQEWAVPPDHPSIPAGVKASKILFACGASFCPRCKTFFFPEIAGERIEICGRCGS